MLRMNELVSFKAKNFEKAALIAEMYRREHAIAVLIQRQESLHPLECQSTHAAIETQITAHLLELCLSFDELSDVVDDVEELLTRVMDDAALSDIADALCPF